MASQKDYNQNITILRGLSVLLVLLYHLDISLFRNGFLGVDIFFIISGYLISRSLILEKKHNGHINIKNYLYKRFFRIFPTLIFVLTLSFTVCLLMLRPDHFQSFAKSNLTSFFGISNFYYMLEFSNYFNTGAAFQPLLHTWSLSVELQFYLLIPILIIFFSTNRQKFLLIILFIISLICFVFLYEKSLSFYFTPFRFWEFILGILVNFLPRIKNKNHVSIPLIIIFFLLFLNIPSYFLHFIVSVSAVLFIISNQIKENILILPFSYLGKISYSLFLIHWPVIVIFNYYYIQNYDLQIKTILTVFILLISHFSWRYIENKFLYKNIKKIKISLFKFILIIFPILLTLFSLYQKNITQIDSNYYKFINNEISNENYLKKLLKKNKNNKFKKKIFIFGDSHATDLANAINLNNNKLEYNINLQNIDISCIKNTNNKFQKFKNKILIKTCIDGQKSFKEIYLNKVNSNDILIFSFYWQKNHLNYLENFIQYLEQNTNNKIYLMLQIPVIRNISVSNLKELNNFENFAYNSLEKKQDYNIQILEILKNYNIIPINLSDKICNSIKKICFVKEDDKNLYFDKHHWTLDGEKFYGKYIIKALTKNINLKN